MGDNPFIKNHKTVQKHSITEKIPSGFYATNAKSTTIKAIKSCYLALGMASKSAQKPDLTPCCPIHKREQSLPI
jgi:hypothetical protein